MKVHVQSYSETYKNQVGKLIVDIQQNEFQIPINLEQQPDLLDIPNYSSREKNGNFWVALDNDWGRACITA